MIKIGKYIFVIIPLYTQNFDLCLSYSNNIQYRINNNDNNDIWEHLHFRKCKYLKPATGIRYKILDKFGIILTIKQLN